MPAAQGRCITVALDLLEKGQTGTTLLTDIHAYFKHVVEPGRSFEINLDKMHGKQNFLLLA